MNKALIQLAKETVTATDFEKLVRNSGKTRLVFEAWLANHMKEAAQEVVRDLADLIHLYNE